MERIQQRTRQIADGDQAKLARLKEILTWFDNEWEISRTVRAMWQCMRKSETVAMRAVGATISTIWLISGVYYEFHVGCKQTLKAPLSVFFN